MNPIDTEVSSLSLPVSDYPKITIITAVYNAGKYLEECIRSVLNQSYKNFEYIIIDGGSTDNTVNIIKKYQHQLSYWLSEPDHGIYDAWNKGLAKANGEWIAFVGADDQLYSDALQNYIQHIIKHPKQHELEFISSRIELVSENLSPIRIVGTAWVWNLFKREMCTWHVGCFHSKNLFIKYGLFDLTYKICGDYELLLRPKDRLIASFVDQVTVKMRTGGVSHIMLSEAMDETYRAKVKNGVILFTRGQLGRLYTKLFFLSRRFLYKK